MVKNVNLPTSDRSELPRRVWIKEPGNIEIAPGVFYMSEPGKHNMIVCKHNQGSQDVVHLQTGFEVNYARLIRKGKALRVKGKIAEQECAMTMLFGAQGRVYAVGKAAKTDSKGRVVKMENNNINTQFLVATNQKSIA